MPDKESAYVTSNTEPRQRADDETDDELRGPSDHAEIEPPEAQQGTSEANPRRPRKILSAHGIVSAGLGVVMIASLIVCSFFWSSHRSDIDEHSYQTQARKTAADWALVLTNMNNDNLDASLRRLRDGTAGQLKSDFDSAMQPFREMVRRLPLHSVSQIESVVIQAVHHDLGSVGTSPSATPQSPRSEIGARTDTIQLEATSIRGAAGAQPQMVYWNLLIDVSDVNGILSVTRLTAMQ